MLIIPLHSGPEIGKSGQKSDFAFNDSRIMYITREKWEKNTSARGGF